MESLLPWIVSLASGGAGGNVAGALLKEKNLGPLLNSILGGIGGLAGGQLLPQLIEGLQGGGTGQNAGLSALVGTILPVIVAFLKKKT